MIDMWPLGVGQRLHLKRLFPPVSLTGAHPPYHHGVTHLSYLPGQWGTQLAKHTHIWNISRFLNKKEMESGPLMFCCTPGSCCRQLGKHLRVDKSKPGFRCAATEPHLGRGGPFLECPPTRYHKHTPPGVQVQMLLRTARLVAPPAAREGVRASAEHRLHGTPVPATL